MVEAYPIPGLANRLSPRAPIFDNLLKSFCAHGNFEQQHWVFDSCIIFMNDYCIMYYNYLLLL
jgi:hypothetical protein